ncbi:MAG: trypsin-like peptidase domain-containing protein [Polyangiales bacterium]
MIRLTVLSGARSGSRVERAQPVIRLGRAPDNDLPFDPNVDLDASAYHAEIRADQGRWIIVDIGSRNGLFLPMQGMTRIQQHVLGPIEQIQLGPQGPRVQIEVLAPPPMQAAMPQQPMPQQPYAQPPQQGYAGAPQAFTAPQQPAYAPPQPGAPPAGGWAAPATSPMGGPPPGVPAMQPPAQPPGAAPAPGGGPKMGQQTLLAHVGAMLNQKRGKSTQEIRALVEKDVKKATGRLKTIIGVLVGLGVVSLGAIIVVAVRSKDPAELRAEYEKELQKLSMNDPKRKELEKKLAGLTGQDGNIGRTVYDGNKNALFMLVAHRGKSYDKGGFCTAFAIKPRVLASNAHCVKAAEDFEDKGADIWAHLNESNNGGSNPKMFKVASHKGHPKYRHNANNITPDVGLFALEEDDAPGVVKLADRSDLKKLGTGDALFVIGFPGRTMDEASPVAVFMYSHVGRVTDALGQRADSFEDDWLIQHEGQTTPGTSGSPIFNGAGQVVAINAGGLLESNKQSVYKYAMRIDLLEDIKLDEGGKKKKKKKSSDDDDDD